MNAEHLEFVIGADYRIADLLNEKDVMPLLQQGAAVGLTGVRVVDDRERVLWTTGAEEAPPSSRFPLALEGENIGEVRCSGHRPSADVAVKIIGGALNAMLLHSLKRKLTTVVHTQVVNQSYSELLEVNQQLADSEKRYRLLAESLERRVQERTAELQQAYTRMLQQEKLASVGQLAAGMAHEINNPLGFMLSNLNAMQKYVDRFREMLDFCRAQAAGLASAADRTVFEARWARLKIDLILEDAQALIDQSRSGGERVKEIVAGLKGFSHIDDLTNQVVDINQELERTLRVMAHEVPEDVEIRKDFQDLPAWSGPSALLCQAFFNLLRNAFQCRPRGLVLSLETRALGEQIQVVIGDNGPGIPAELQSRVFEPFFTTREIGQGRGMGLALVYDVVQSCRGTIDLDSQPGQGARFTLTLPCQRGDHGQIR